MNNKALQLAYTNAVEQGFKHDINTFYNILSTQEKALQLAWNDAASKGYKGDIDTFSDLLGLKKKPNGEASGLEQPSPAQSAVSLPSVATGGTSLGTPPLVNLNESRTLQGISRPQAIDMGYSDDAWVQANTSFAENIDEQPEPSFLGKMIQEGGSSHPMAYATAEALHSMAQSDGFAGKIFNVLDEAAEGWMRARPEEKATNIGILIGDAIQSGEEITQATVEEYLSVLKAREEFQARYGTDEYYDQFSADWDKYTEETGSVWTGWFAAIAENPAAAFTSSVENLSKMVNLSQAQRMGEAALTTITSLTAAGSVIPGVGNLAGFLGGVAAAAPTAMAWSSYNLERGLETFNAIEEYLNSNGLEANAKNVSAVANDRELMLDIVAKAKNGASIIGFVDLATMGVGSKIAKAPIKAALRQGTSVTRAVTTGTLMAAPVEFLGEGFGEAAKIAVTEEEATLDDISRGFLEEATGAIFGGFKSAAVAGTQLAIEGNTKSYSLNGKSVSREAMGAFIQSADRDQINTANISISNDKKLADILSDRTSRMDIERSIDPSIKGKDRARLVELMRERQIVQEEAGIDLKGDEKSARNRVLASLQEEIDSINEKYAETAVSERRAKMQDPLAPPVQAPQLIEPRQAGPIVDEAINKKAVLVEYNGNQVNQEGDLYVDGQTLVLETQDRIYEIGNVNEVSDMEMSDVGLAPVTEEVSVNNDGTIRVDNQNWNIQTDLDNRGIEYNKDGDVTRVSLKDNEGKTVMYEGQKAEDIAYQIMLSEIQTPEQEQRVNELLEQDEQFKEQSRLYAEQRERDEQSRTAKTTTQERADKGVKEGAKSRVSRDKKTAKDTAKKVEAKQRQQKTETAAQRHASSIYRRALIANDPKEKARLISYADDLESSGHTFSPEQKELFDGIKQDLKDRGYIIGSQVKVGDEWTPRTKGKAVFVPDPTKEIGQRVVTRITNKGLYRDGKTVSQPTYIVNIGTQVIDKNRVNGKDTRVRARNVSTLKEIMSSVFSLQDSKANAAAKVGDRLISNMAKRAGISKEDMYDRISFAQATSIDQANNNIKYQQAVEKLKTDINKIPFLNEEMVSAMIDNGRLTIGKYEVSDFTGAIVLHTPDGMFSGTINLPDGNVIEGNGGVFYPMVFSDQNYFWAGTKNTVSTTINQLEKAAKRSKDGKVRMALTMSPPDKLLSNTTASRGLVDMFMSVAFQKEFSLSVSDMKAAMYNSARSLGISLKTKDSVDTMRQAIFDKLDSNQSSFDQRKNFSEAIIGNVSKALGKKKGRASANSNARLVEFFAKASGVSPEQIKSGTRKDAVASKKGMIAAICRTFQEDFLNDIEDTGVVYAVIEVDVNTKGNTFEAVNTEENNLPSHESFPFAIRPTDPNNRVKLHVLKDPKMYYDVVAPEGTSSPMGKGSLRAYPTNAGLSLSPLNIVTRKKEDVINDYLNSINAAKRANPDQFWSVSTPTREELQDSFILETPDGYGYVTPDGDIKGLFKKHTSQSKGVAGSLLEQLIKMGGIKLDNFDGYLTKIYTKAGFKIVSKVKFNVEYAPDEWKDAKERGVDLGTPDVLAMIYDPENKIDVEEKTFEDYDEGMAERDKYVDQVREAYNNMQGIHLYQDKRAGVVMDDVEAIIVALNNPDVTSPLHELAHVFENYLTDGERATVLDWAGHDNWTNDTSEKFAEGFEKYLYEGVAPDKGLERVFNSLKKWIGDIYRGIKNSPLELDLNEDMRSLYELMLNDGNPDNVTTGRSKKRSLYQDVKTKRFRTYTQQALFFVRKKFQDKYAPVMKIQEDLIADGVDVYESSDFKMAEELMHGKTANDLEKRVEVYIDRIIESLKKSGLEVEDLNVYMMALHVKERNQYIMDNYEKEDGSGKSNDWADQTLDYYKDKTDQLEDAAQHVRDLLQSTRERMVEFGLETQGLVDSWENTYENYVPLYGFAQDENMSIDEDYQGDSRYLTGGAGIHVAGPTIKKAKGRETEAANVVGNAVQLASAVVIKSRKNEALQSLYNLIIENPSESYYISDKSKGSSSVGVRIDGDQKYIVFKDRSVAEALNGMTVEKTDMFTKLYSWGLMGWMRKAYTTYNPEFFVTNFARDIQTAIIVAMSEEQREGGIALGKKISDKLVGNVGRSWVALAHRLGSNTMNREAISTEMQTYIDEWEENGGKTGWSHIKPAEQVVSEIQNKIKENSSTLSKVTVPVKAVFNFVEGVNEVFENSIRLAAYVSAREAGLSPEKSAQLSKNITINFNKYGEWGRAANSIWLFFNAGVQGTTRLATSLFTMKPKKTALGETLPTYKRFHRAQYAVAGLTALNALMTALNLSISGEDEDGELFYNKIPDYEKERNIIVMMQDGEHYIKIPMPYGLNAFSSMGEAIAATAMGERDSYDATMFTISSMMNAFIPVQFSSSEDAATSLLQTSAPSIIKPFIDMAVNETYNGGTVTRNNLPYGAKVPDSYLSKRAPESVRSGFQWLNEVSGGSENVSGEVDLNPDYMWYYMQYLVGAPMVFGERSISLAKNITRRALGKPTIDLEANDIIFLRKVYGEPSKFYDYNLYQERLERLEQIKKELFNPNVDIDIKRRREMQDAALALTKLNDKLIKKMSEISRMLVSSAQKIEDPIERNNKVEGIYDDFRSQVKLWNKMYNEMEEKLENGK